MPVLDIEVERVTYPVEVSSKDGTNHGADRIIVLRYYRAYGRTWAYLRRTIRKTHRFRTGPRWFKVHDDQECWSLAEVTEYTGIGQRMGFMTILRFVADSQKRMVSEYILKFIHV